MRRQQPRSRARVCLREAVALATGAVPAWPPLPTPPPSLRPSCSPRSACLGAPSQPGPTLLCSPCRPGTQEKFESISHPVQPSARSSVVVVYNVPRRPLPHRSEPANFRGSTPDTHEALNFKAGPHFLKPFSLWSSSKARTEPCEPPRDPAPQPQTPQPDASHAYWGGGGAVGPGRSPFTPLIFSAISPWRPRPARSVMDSCDEGLHRLRLDDGHRRLVEPWRTATEGLQGLQGLVGRGCAINLQDFDKTTQSPRVYLRSYIDLSVSWRNGGAQMKRSLGGLPRTCTHI